MLAVTYGYKDFQTKTITFHATDLASTQRSIIQDALDAVAGHAGGFVRLSGGTFTVSGTGKACDGALRVGSNTVLMGAGIGETVITLALGSAGVRGVVRAGIADENTDGSAKIASNIRIESLTIDGNKAGIWGDVDGFCCEPEHTSAEHHSKILLDRIEVTNVTHCGFGPNVTTSGLAMSNCVSHGSSSESRLGNAWQAALFDTHNHAGDHEEFSTRTGPNGVLFQDKPERGDGQSGTVVQTRDNEETAFAPDVPISGASVCTLTPRQEAIARGPNEILEHRGMNAIWRGMAISKCLDVDDHFLAHVDAPFNGRRAHMRQGNDAIRV